MPLEGDARPGSAAAERDRLRGILDSIGEAVVALDASARVTDINAAALALDRRTREEVIGRACWEIWPGLDTSAFGGVVRRALAGEASEVDSPYRSQSRRETLWINMRAYPAADGGATMFYRDVSARRATEERVRESEDRFRRIADSAPVPMWVTRLDRKRDFVNTAYAQFLGAAYDDALVFDWREIIHPHDAPRLYREQSEKEASLQPFSLEARYRRADGEWRWLRSESQPRFGAAGELDGFIGVAHDVTDAKQAQGDLQQMNERLEQRVAERTQALQDLFDKAPLPLHSLTEDARVLSVSDRWLEFMGYDSREEVLGRPAADFVAPVDAERIMREYWPRLLSEGETADAEYRLVKRSGDVAETLISSRVLRDAEGRFVRTMGAVMDVTARRRAEEQLRQAQKMEAVGQLTGGIAHDFNNLLTAVLGSLDLLRRRPGDPERQRRLLETAIAGAERGAKLTRQLLAFSRSQKLTLEPVDVAGAVGRMFDLLDRSVGPGVVLRLQIGPVGAVLADANQLENALLNLAVNARDAMPFGGVVSLAARRARIGEGDPELSPGDYVEIAVADTGDGMTSEVLSRALDPFFTTKPTGQGTGLGLSQVYGFARQSGGTVRIDSAPGAGTRVRILLRAAEAEGSGAVDGAGTNQADAEPTGRRERLLIVDDDDEVRAFLVACAEDLGYHVEAASGGAEGLALLQAGDFDLAVLDYAMPEMTGAEAARRMRALEPALPIVFATGFADMEALEAAVGDAPVLRKPFLLAELAAVLRAALPDGAG